MWSRAQRSDDKVRKAERKEHEALKGHEYTS